MITGIYVRRANGAEFDTLTQDIIERRADGLSSNTGSRTGAAVPCWRLAASAGATWRTVKQPTN